MLDARQLSDETKEQRERQTREGEGVRALGHWVLGLGLGLSSDRSGIGEEKLDPGPVQHSMAGCGAHARSRRFLRVPCGELPVFLEVPFSRPVAPRLDTFIVYLPCL